jgi:RimJ/RimL family protein N-acetyltransferase
MRDKQVLLETERLALRCFSEGDAGNLYDLDNDPEVMRFLNGGIPTPREVIEADILPRFASYDECTPGFGFWAAIDRVSGAFLGWFSFRPLGEADPLEVQLGFRLRRVAWGQGYATEGARALIHLGFTELGVERVTATTYEENVASRRVLEKAGMTLARRFRMTSADFDAVDTYQTAFQDPWDGDDLLYALQKADWKEKASSLSQSPFRRVGVRGKLC